MKLKVLLLAALAATGVALADPPSADNPLLTPSDLPFHAPRFDRIKVTDYPPALEEGMRLQDAEIEAIANNPDPPTFDNTMVAMERSGAALARVDMVFEAIAQADTTPAIEKIQEEEAPRLAAHQDSIYQNAKLFQRIQTLYDQKEQLDAVNRHLLDITWQKFIDAGAKLAPEQQARLRELNKEEASLSTQFHDRLLADTNAKAVRVTRKSELAGLSAADVATAAHDAKGKGWLFTLENTTQQPILVSMSDRALRQQILAASKSRDDHPGPNDTRGIITRLAALRTERAHLLGYSTAAALILEDQMAKTPETAEKALTDLVPAATAQARKRAAELQHLMPPRETLTAADWEYYNEKLRTQRVHVSDSDLKPYFELNRVLQDGVFYAANKLYGLTFKPRTDIPVYNPDVRVFEVFDKDGSSLALLYLDYYQRPSKSGGAWEDSFVEQNALTGDKPVVFNVTNFPKPAPGQPTLLSFDDVTTMFHEFGHALHAMFSKVPYPSLAGTNVPRDWAEYPSQFNEHWASYPAVLANYARHYRTGAPMPAALMAKVKEAGAFNQGYDTTEYLSASLLDLAWHTIPLDGAPAPSGVDAFEAAALKRFHVDLPEVPPRYRSTYFNHIWEEGYQAGYYAYLWSEILDDDTFYWFKAHGGMTRENGQRYRDMILSQGNSLDVAQLYRNFMGREPSVEPLLIERGLKPALPGR